MHSSAREKNRLLQRWAVRENYIGGQLDYYRGGPLDRIDVDC